MHNRFTTEDCEKFMRAIGYMTNWNLDIFDTKHTISEILAVVRKHVHDQPEEKRLVIISN